MTSTATREAIKAQVTELVQSDAQRKVGERV
ncbi:hypothetical protein ABIE67_006783 [Streptomyces sp. V4I8]